MKKKYYILVIEWSYDYEGGTNAFLYPTKESAQKAMKKGFDDFAKEEDMNLFSESSICDTTASHHENGDWTKNHISWDILERELEEE